jgi:uncharacterized protein
MNVSSITPTSHLFRPVGKDLLPFSEFSRDLNRAREISIAIAQMLTQKDYPCVAAVKAFHTQDYEVGIYGSFGSGASWRDLRHDLLFFIEQQRQSGSIFLSFWAVFDEKVLTEEEFERSMWRELSCLTSAEDRISDWPKFSQSSNPEEPSFRFGLDGSEFFVVGLHANSSRHARRFRLPALIFNVFEQFDKLQQLGQYGPMVKLNRARDLKFQGSVNPMAEAHGEKWESIQFSGKENPPNWKCPFHFLKRAAKP